jgi:hypothetical protein
MVFNNNYHKDRKKPNRIARHRSLVTDGAVHKVTQTNAKTKAKAIYKKRISNPSQKQQVEQELQESYDRWEHETDVISRVMRLARSLGHFPDLFDLYCAGFQKEQIDIIQEFPPCLYESEPEMMEYSESEPFHLSLLAQKAIAMETGEGLM